MNKLNYSTICRFRNELLKTDLYDKLFREINRQLDKRELIVKKGVIIDATVIESARRPRKIVEAIPEDRKKKKRTPK
jgi:IS5 family transposase